MLGLDLKSLIVGILLGYFVLTRLHAALAARAHSAK